MFRIECTCFLLLSLAVPSLAVGTRPSLWAILTSGGDCKKLASGCDCGWGSCLSHIGYTADSCCAHSQEFGCCEAEEGQPIYSNASIGSYEFVWPKKCFIAVLIMSHLLQRRHIQLMIFG
ncbi:hypothetical protein GPALN_004924 [Globodera pallida]|nr:hypothetical protein GPALN_004924 [Globodera pallida]